MKDVLAIIGIISIAAMIIFVIIMITLSIKEKIEELMLKYKQKHRFDKPPTAKCYCVDCIYHDNKTGKCDRLKDWHTADCWFCWNGTPRKKERSRYDSTESN